MKNANIGEIHTWLNGESYKKTASGWEHIPSPAHDQKSVVGRILDKIEPFIQQKLERAEKQFEEDFKRPMSKWDKESARLMATYEVVRALERYTKPGDKVTDYITVRNAPSGGIEIHTFIERDGKNYEFTTDVIYAGGHNIQSLHFRYLVKTQLPQTGNKTFLQQLDEKRKRMNKVERLNEDLKHSQSVLKRYEDELQKLSSMNDEDVLRTSWFEKFRHTTWEDMKSRGADKNFEGGQEAFEAHQKKSADDILNHHKHSVEVRLPFYIKMQKKEIAKIENKIEDLLEVL